MAGEISPVRMSHSRAMAIAKRQDQAAWSGLSFCIPTTVETKLICISQNFNERRARAAHSGGDRWQGSGASNLPPQRIGFVAAVAAPD